MRFETLRPALAELPDEVVLALSEQVRQQISRQDPEPGVQGEDHIYSGARESDWRSVDGELDPYNVRELLAYKDLALGWKIARECAKRRLPLPSVLAWGGEALHRAYMYLINPKMFPDRSVRKALLWQTKAMTPMRNSLEGLIVSADMTPAKIATTLLLDEEDIRVYEQLFFNITSRKMDALWLSTHVYPNTRMVEFYDGYVQSVPFQQLLRRSGIKNGADHVLQLAGISSDPLDAMAAATSAAQLESYLLTTGLLMAQNGWGNEKSNATAIFHSRHLMTAAKMGGEETSAGSEYMTMSDTLWDEMLRVKRPEAERAYRLQNAAQAPIDVQAETI